MTVGHAFKDTKTVFGENPYQNATFKIQDVPPKRIKIDIGTDGANITLGSASMSDGNDYGLVRLKEPVTGAKR